MYFADADAYVSAASCHLFMHLSFMNIETDFLPKSFAANAARERHITYRQCERANAPLKALWWKKHRCKYRTQRVHQSRVSLSRADQVNACLRKLCHIPCRRISSHWLMNATFSHEILFDIRCERTCHNVCT